MLPSHARLCTTPLISGIRALSRLVPPLDLIAPVRLQVLLFPGKGFPCFILLRHLKKGNAPFRAQTKPKPATQERFCKSTLFAARSNRTEHTHTHPTRLALQLHQLITRCLVGVQGLYLLLSPFSVFVMLGAFSCYLGWM